MWLTSNNLRFQTNWCALVYKYYARAGTCTSRFLCFSWILKCNILSSLISLFMAIEPKFSPNIRMFEFFAFTLMSERISINWIDFYKISQKNLSHRTLSHTHNFHFFFNLISGRRCHRTFRVQPLKKFFIFRLNFHWKWNYIDTSSIRSVKLNMLLPAMKN